MTTPTVEAARLAARFPAGQGWKKWGPYLAERQWGTVREDYSPHGNAWEYFPHDHARSRAYRWGEDGIGGFSDDQQRLCLALALWNTQDPILKERLFGLTNGEGNHGEDVKELYYYLDATPSHSYLKMLYKYPQAAFPYARLLAENRRRGIHEPEYELIDTGVFDEQRYFDVFIEYAQAEPDDILMRITAHNRAATPAPLHLLPHIWFRNTWSWKAAPPRPALRLARNLAVHAMHPKLGAYYLCADGAVGTNGVALFCDNESNPARLWNDSSARGWWKDAIDERVVQGHAAAVNPAGQGTKAALWYRFEVPAHGSVQLRLRLTKSAAAAAFADFDRLFADRIREADEFYARLQHGVDGNGLGGLQHRLAVGDDEASLDRSLGAGPAFEQSALDQQQVRALARGRIAVVPGQVQSDVGAGAEASLLAWCAQSPTLRRPISTESGGKTSGPAR